MDERSIRTYSPYYQPSSSRIDSLDLIKGIALLFGLFVSVYVWGGFTDGLQYELIGKSKGARHIIYVALSFFLEGKMRGLISIAFGAGMVLFMVSPHKGSGLSNAELLVRRNLWLMAFGLFNAFIFLWPQDILFHLGIMGLLLFPFCRMNARGLMIAVVLLILIGGVKNYWYFADDKHAYNKYLVLQSLEKKFSKDSAARMKTNDSTLFKKRQAGPVGIADSVFNQKVADSLAKKAGDTLTRKQKDEKQAWEGIAKKYSRDAKADSANNKALQQNNYAKNWNHLLQNIKSRESGWFYRNGVWEFSALILLGMLLLKIGFFNNRFTSSQYMLMAFAGIILGLACGWYRLHFHHLAVQNYAEFVKSRSLPHTVLWSFERAFMVFGIAAKMVWLVQKGIFRKLTGVFADVGKLALSNYLLQSILLSVFFYGYGMGYFGRLSTFRLYFLVVEVSIIQVVFSVLWTRYFYYGPAEWLLHSVIHKRKLPFLKRENEIRPTLEKELHTAI